MKNYVQPGHVVTVPVPIGGVLSGQALAVGSLFGVAAYTAPAGGDVELSLIGVFNLPKDASAIAVGAKVYWDEINNVATATVGSNPLIGACLLAAAITDTTARVRLNGVTTA